MLRQIWKDRIVLNWQFGLSLILLLGIPRFILVLQANMTGNYNLIPVIFMLMILSPYLLLSKSGRTHIGIKRPVKISRLFYCFLSGIGACIIAFSIATFFFGFSMENCFVYISKSYAVPAALSSSDRLIYFIIYALIGMSFSPIGEELFYRGLVHSSFADQFGEKQASAIDSSAFALTHLAHFGIVYLAGTWKFLFFPALLWLLMMYLASRLFFICKQKSGSLIGAILCHSGFNLAMMYFIFYKII